MPAKSRTTSDKINKIHVELKALARRFEKSHQGLAKNQQGFEKRLQGFNKRQQSFNKRQQSFEKRQQGFEATLQQFNKRQDKFDHDLEEFREKMFALLYHEINEAEKARTESRKVIDQIHTIADRIAKRFDDFTVEKMALGARDDRIEGRVESLENSDVKQNRTIEKLDTRLTYLEARQPE